MCEAKGQVECQMQGKAHTCVCGEDMISLGVQGRAFLG